MLVGVETVEGSLPGEEDVLEGVTEGEVQGLGREVAHHIDGVASPQR